MDITMTIRSFCGASAMVKNSQNRKREREEEEEEQGLPRGPNRLSESGESKCQPSDHPRGAVRLEDLTFHKEIGSGTYGKVMLASHSATEKVFAVKMVKKRRMLRYSRDFILAERQALELTQDSQLFTHCYGTFQNEDYLFYMMEYVSRGDLGDFLEQRAPCEMDTTRFISAEIVAGLRHLHKKGIIHRDLKPENVLLNSAGHIKIADFGVAAIVSGLGMVQKHVGTLGYMAPEVLLHLPYGSSVDFFSFGAILFELATGKLPFEEKEDTKVIRSLEVRVEYPRDLHLHIKVILEGLFCVPTERQAFCETICTTPLFEGINWEDLEAGRVSPPYTLQPAPVVDTTKKISLDAEDSKQSLSEKEEELFQGFTYTSTKPY